LTVPPSDHWAQVWAERDATEVSWYQASPSSSLAMIEETGAAADAPIIDVGGGASSLAGCLLEAGFTDVTVTDISAAALERARASLGSAGARIAWVRADVRDHEFGRRFAVWHDRALFHFMVDPADRDAYLRTLGRSVSPGAHLIVATFGPDGPTTCSGLPVVRYGPDELAEAFAPAAQLVSSRLEDHRTPSGAIQQFLVARLDADRPAS